MNSGWERSPTLGLVSAEPGGGGQLGLGLGTLHARTSCGAVESTVEQRWRHLEPPEKSLPLSRQPVLTAVGVDAPYRRCGRLLRPESWPRSFTSSSGFCSFCILDFRLV